ncbi:cadherin domain-containing protein [Nocardioides sp.]|uniref:cadherin domain-containing protein n=1 Tax=Nocardioides sp. TaxID=35761 RepID=UPI00261D3971|nr:cadherin domain-containing protein [Nocardioides sp.]
MTLILGLILTGLGTFAVASAPASAAATTVAPALAQDLCATTKGRPAGALRVTTTGRCTARERLVRLSVATPTTVCLTRSKSVYLIARTGFTAKTCATGKVRIKRATVRKAALRGTKVAVPSRTTVLVCTTGAKTRWTATAAGCRGRLSRLADLAPIGLRLSGTTVVDGAPAGTVIGTLTATDPNRGDRLSYRLVPGAGGQENAAVRVQGNRIVLATALDAASLPALRIRFQAVDLLGLSTTATASIAVRRVPTVSLALSPATVAEGSGVGTVIGTVTAAPAGARFADLRLVSGPGDTDNAAVSAVGSHLELATVPDYETQASYDVRVAVTDHYGSTVEQALTITVGDVNEAPHDLSLSPAAIDEGRPAGSTVGTLSAIDPDAGDHLTYAVTTPAGTAGATAFTTQGDLLITTQELLFTQAPVGGYQVTVTTTDSGGLHQTATFTVTVNDVLLSPTDLALSPTTVSERRPAGERVGDLSATDGDSDPLTYTLVSGEGSTDNALFTIVGTELRTAVTLQHADGDRSVRIRVSDGTSAAPQERAFTITVSEYNLAPSAPTLTPASVAEHQPVGTVVGTLAATDPDGDPVTYAISGPDAADFTLSGTQLLTATRFDVETTPTRTLTVTASDDHGHATSATLTVTVTNVNEAPTDLALSHASIAENLGNATIGTLSASDPDAGDTFTYAVTPSTFKVVGAELRTADGAGFDFETTPTVTATVTVTDAGGLTFQKTFTITVTNVNEAPTAVADSYTGVLGNTTARAGGTAGTTPETVLSGSLPLANDTDPEHDTLSVVPVTRATARGGSITIAADGSFRYTPPLGVRNVVDTVTYTITDGEFPVTGTISLTIADRLVWYVDPSLSTAGNGASTAPLTSLSATTLGAAGDDLFVKTGLSRTSLTLLASQRLYGAGSGLTFNGATLVAPTTATTLTLTGSAGGLTLGEGSTVSGLVVKATGTGTAVTSTVNTATIDASASIVGGTGTTLSVTGGTGAVSITGPITAGTGNPAVTIASRTGTTTLGAITSAGTSGGVRLTSAGAVTLTGPLTLTTGANPALSATSTPLSDLSSTAHQLSTTTGTALTLNGVALASDLTLSKVSSNGATNGLLINATTGTGRVRVISPAATPSTIQNSTGAGIAVTSARGPVLSYVSVTGGTDGITLASPIDATVADHLTVSNVVNDGLALTGTGVPALTVTSSTFMNNGGDALQVSAQGTASGRVTLTGNTVTGAASGTSQGVVLAASNGYAGTLQVDVTGNTVTGSAGSAVVVSGTGLAGGGRIEGYVRTNQIGSTTTGSCSTTGNGLEVSNDAGVGPVVVALTGNTIRNCAQRGIALLAGDGASSVQATVSGNTVSALSSTTSGYALEGDFGLVAGDLQASCLDASGNTLTSGGTLAGLHLRNRYGSVSLPGYTGASTSTTAVQTYLAGRNVSTTALAETQSGASFLAGACTGPSF